MNPIILFDGYCNLCNKSVDFILRHDRKHQFRFASLQSGKAKDLLKEINSEKEIASRHLQLPDSVILIVDGNIYTESTAALQIIGILGFPWNLLYVFTIVPLKWRDGIYRWIARNRYRWFGKKETCRIPNKEEREYFLD